MIVNMTQINRREMQNGFLNIVANEIKDGDTYVNVLLLKGKKLKMNQLKT